MGVKLTYIPLPQKEDGGQKKVWTSDDYVREILLEILEELKTMNLHLESITEEETEGEIK